MLLALPQYNTAQRAQQQYRQHKARVLTLGLAGPRTGRLARCHSHSQSSSDKTMHSHTLAQTHPHLEWPPQDQQHKLSPQQQQPSRSESLKETYLQSGVRGKETCQTELKIDVPCMQVDDGKSCALHLDSQLTHLDPLTNQHKRAQQ